MVAPVSALVVNDNSVSVTVQPGESEGDPASISLSPAIECFTILNRVLTGGASGKAIHVEREAGSREIVIWGRIGLGETPAIEKLAVPEPALFAASCLRDALLRRGIAVSGQATARHRWLADVPDAQQGEPAPASSGVELAQRISPPLIELVQVVDKVSQNLHAEILLREVGAARRNMGTLQAGLAEMRDFLKDAGISEEQVRLRDGSGLSRNALVTPEAIVKLLVFVYRSQFREQFLSLLPVGGEDGSLRKRFLGHPEARGIHAKTGTLSDVHALSGYATSQAHGLVAFSLVVNNVSGDGLRISQFLDNIGLKLLS